MSNEQPTIEDGEETVQSPPVPKVVLQDQPPYQPDMPTLQRQWDLQRERAKQDKLKGLALGYPEVAELIQFKEKASAIIASLSLQITELKERLGEEGEPIQSETVEPSEEGDEEDEDEDSDEASDEASGDASGDFSVPAKRRRRRRRKQT